MTTPAPRPGMTDRDPTLQAEMDRAAAELARRIRPWATGMADPDSFARRFVEDLHAEGWWPHPRPLPIAPKGPPSPPNTEWRRAAAKIRGESTDA
ncbi:hypothetical protein [Actinomadura sp. SCN-SB]|uniref:hypothetical protein n=1 Tax=Actinomadura sp. SCN-SB TaxID=3373092 RepID=UPI00375000F3